MTTAVNVSKLMHSGTATPVCRIHIYQDKDGQLPRSKGAAKPPVHWCTPELNAAYEKPSYIVGKDGYNLRTGIRSEWQLLEAQTNGTRQWSCSQAKFMIARPVSLITYPESPPVRPNDIIVVEMGYVKGNDTRSCLSDGRTDYTAFAGDVVFFGMVDTVKERGGSGEKDGIVVTVMARDMMSCLVDNKVRGSYAPSMLGDYNRAFIIRDLIWRGAAIDYVKWDEDGLGQYVRTSSGLKTPIYEEENGQQVIVAAPFSEENCYLDLGVLEVSEREEVKIPEEGNNQGIVIMDRFPLDVIKHFSLVETAPRELWADHRTGKVNWMYRRTDMRRLNNNPEDRQYFYMYPPERANIISYTMEWSTAGTVTHFTVSNPLSSVSNETKHMEIYAESPTAVLHDPHTGRPLRSVTRNRFIYDDTLIGDSDGEAVVNSLFNIWGRTIETGMVMIQGDPSLVIGEAVQIFNTGMFGRRYHHAKPETLDNTYANKTDPNPEGIFRVEAVTHMYAVGGVQTAYRSVFVLGPVDANTGDPPRIIKKNEDWAKVKKIDVTQFRDVGNMKSES